MQKAMLLVVVDSGLWPRGYVKVSNLEVFVVYVLVLQYPSVEYQKAGLDEPCGYHLHLLKEESHFQRQDATLNIV